MIAALVAEAQQDSTRLKGDKSAVFDPRELSCRDCRGTIVFIDGVKTDSVKTFDSTEVYSSTKTGELVGERFSATYTDRKLDNHQNYYQMGVLGNMGLPSYSLLATDNSQSGFFNWMNLNHSNDLFTDKQPVYFYPQGKIYTKIFAAMGQKQEQVFKLVHSQNIKRVNISLQFNRYSCFGFYVFQRTITDNLLFSSHATTKSGKAGYNFYYMYNKLKYQLNGGIDSSKADFSKNILVDKQLFPTNLSTSKQNIRTSEVDLSAFVKINKDSLGISHQLVYEGNYQANYWMFSDGFADSARYTHNYFYYASGTNRDSVSFKRFSNSVFYKLKADNFALYGGYKNELNHYNQFTIDITGTNHILIAGGGINSRNQSLNVHGQYVAAGFNASNYLLNADYYLNLGKKFYATVFINAGKQMPPYMSVAYVSPHFIWSDTLSNVITQNAHIVFGSRKYAFRLGAFIQQQQNQVYFDTLALPKQYRGSTLVSRFYIQKDLKLGLVHFNNTVNYQTTPNADIIRLPDLNTSHQLYLESKLFKKKLWLQVGFQARYISSFKANAYMPATNQFYLQNSKEYGNYVFVDFFLNAQIERFRFFLMASHLNQGLSGSNYMLCPNYAMPDRSLKAGLTWMFFD